MSTQHEDFFSHKLAHVEQCAGRLYCSVQPISRDDPQLVTIDARAIELLRDALEELQIAEEELRQQNEELLRARHTADIERQRYQELFEFAPDGYLVTDLYGKIREANWAAATLFNINHKYLVGKLLVNFILEEQRHTFRSMLNQILTVNRIQEWEIKLCGRETEVFDAALTIETVQDYEGNPISLRWLIRNVTVRKQAEEQLKLAQLQNLRLIEANRIKSQFMATVSHELRTPMTAILGFSELLLRRFQQQQDFTVINMLERIFRNGKHLLTLIEELLDFSKLQANCLELRLESFDLVEFTTNTVDELRPLAEQKMLDLQIHASHSGLIVLNDRMRLRQILTNLLSNAIKFTDEGSVTIEICELPEARVAVIVRDTGIGIDPADQTRIFREFWQVNQTITRHHGGTGLGLAIVQSLVQLMQGSITVESQVSQGSMFRIEMPQQVTKPSASQTA